MSEINYCANGCTRRHGDESIPVTTEGKSQLCTHCEDRLGDWLTHIPDAYALLPTFVEHGTTDRNPEAKTTKSATAPAPMRLDIIDLLDTRLGRKWNGTQPTTDRRGTLGTLTAWTQELIDERPLTHPGELTVTGCCNLLNRHRLWLAEQDWIADLYDDVRKIHRALADAVGDYRQKPVGHCKLVPEGRDEPCGGPLFANKAGGVRCLRCSETWNPNQLRLLGLELAEQDTA